MGSKYNFFAEIHNYNFFVYFYFVLATQEKFQLNIVMISNDIEISLNIYAATMPVIENYLENVYLLRCCVCIINHKVKYAFRELYAPR
jgi:hypothetical protein